jgi:hypothetical protein
MAYILLTNHLVFFIQTAYGNVQDHGSGSSSNDIADDPDVLAAMEMFAGMSPDEIEETIKELMLIVDDPEMQANFQEILDYLIPMMQQESEGGSNLQQMAEDDEVTAATQEAVRLLGNSDWESLWEKQDVILEAVITSGKITEEAAEVFRTDESMWEEQLRFIWDEMQKQALLEQEL